MDFGGNKHNPEQILVALQWLFAVKLPFFKVCGGVSGVLQVLQKYQNLSLIKTVGVFSLLF